MIRKNKQKKKFPNYAFIDGQNIETGLWLAGFEIDFQKLYEYLLEKYKVEKVYYCVKFSKHLSRINLYK
jgi:hypothetical protein